VAVTAILVLWEEKIQQENRVKIFVFPKLLTDRDLRTKRKCKAVRGVPGTRERMTWTDWVEPGHPIQVAKMSHSDIPKGWQG
jgi:hypothetical protein